MDRQGWWSKMNVLLVVKFGFYIYIEKKSGQLTNFLVSKITNQQTVFG